MKLSFPNVLVLVLSVLAASSLKADLITEATFGSGYQGNLFNDSSSTGDAYASAGMVLKYFPSATTQVAAGLKYNAFSKYEDLSNLGSDLSITIIPTPLSWPLSVTLRGAVASRGFGKLYEMYDQVGATVGIDAGYRLAPWAHWQSSVSYISTSYTNADFGSNRSIDLSTGINVTVPGSNSLAFRADYSRRSFDQPSLIQGGSGHTLADGQDESEMFEITGYLMRYSRPLGERTGLNVSFAQRLLHVDRDYTVLGYTIDYLSPWSDLWEGISCSGGLKHFFPKQIIADLSFTYFDKSFVDVIEFGDSVSEAYWQGNRNDQLTTVGLSVSKAVSLRNGKQLTPSFNLGYRDNQSSAGFFDYNDFQASFSLKMSL